MRRFPAQLVFMVICLLLLGYFGYHGIHGKHGLEASHRVNAELLALQDEISRLQSQKEALEHRISLMLPESLDPDMLDESARATLGFASPRDLIILRPKN